MAGENSSITIETCFLQSGGVAATFYYSFTVCFTAPFLLLGLVGNAIALAVFRAEWRNSQRGANSMTVLLTALSAGNLAMVSFALITFQPSEIYCFAQVKILEPYILELLNVNSLVYAVDDAIHMFLIYTILAVAVERWLAAYFPIQRRSTMFTLRRIVRYLAVVFVFSLLFQLPRVMQRRVQNIIDVLQLPISSDVANLSCNVSDVSQEQDDGELRSILDKEMKFSVETVTHEVQSPFQAMYRLTHTLTEQVIPMLIAAVVHVCLMVSLKKAKRCRNFLIRLNSSNNETLQVNRRHSLSRIDRSAQLAFITVTVFIICEMPLCVNKVLEVVFYMHGSEQLQESVTVAMTAFHGIAHCIIHLQSSLNLILYCWTSTKFRMSFKQVCARSRSVTLGRQRRFGVHAKQPGEVVVAYINNNNQSLSLNSPCSPRRTEKIPVSRKVSNQLSILNGALS